MELGHRFPIPGHRITGERERERQRERERGREAERQRQPIKRIEGGPEVFGPSDDFSVEKFGQSHRSKSAKGGWKASTRA